MQDFLSCNTVFKTHMWMGAYGSATPKGTHLWGPDASVVKFALPLPRREWSEQLVTKKVMADGRIQITGNASLKGSQAYPKEFGRATVGVWKLASKRSMPDPTKKIPNVWSYKQDMWLDANLTDVMQFLSMGTMK